MTTKRRRAFQKLVARGWQVFDFVLTAGALAALVGFWIYEPWAAFGISVFFVVGFPFVTWFIWWPLFEAWLDEGEEVEEADHA